MDEQPGPSSPAGPGPATLRLTDVLVAVAGVPPHVLVDAEHVDAVEAVRVVDQHAFAFGQHGVVGGVPRHGQPFRDPGDGEVGHHDPPKRPPQRRPGQLRAGLGGLGGVLAPHVTTPTAAVAAHRDQQRGGPPPERFVRQPPDHRVPRHAFAAAPVAPVVRCDDPAREHRPPSFDLLPDDLQPELVEASERGQVGTLKVAWSTSRSSGWAV